MKVGSRITEYSLTHPTRVTALMLVCVVIILLAAALPSLRLIDAMPNWVKQASERLDFLPTIKVDTDPENMLPADEPVRVFHREMKELLSLNDIVVVGVVNERNPQGVFNPESLRKIYELTEFAKGLQFDEKDKIIHAVPPTVEPGEESGIDDLEIEGLDLDDSQAGRDDSGETKAASQATQELRGVIATDIIAPSTVDSIEPRGGAIVFSWLMNQPPETQAEALAVRRRAERVPFLSGTLVSEDGKAVAIYLPITDKHLSYKVYRELRERIAQFGDGPEEFHITGLPVAEDTFGVEMFGQMAISAPTAMLVISILMLLFFRKLIIVISPMIVAMVSAIFTMGSLIIASFPIHILSSMIPIFIMPIAVLDSIHIISEFFEKYQITRDRKRTMRAVMGELFSPMLYTSLTSAAGFASLALTPIPPVQVFGVFVAAGIMAAWLLTITFIPAFVMFISPKRLESFGSKHRVVSGRQEAHGLVGRAMYWMGGATYRRAKPILAVGLVVLVSAGYGISRININDNPVKWFGKKHPIRVADRVLNDHFAGTYMAYLSMAYERPKFYAAEYEKEFATRAVQLLLENGNSTGVDEEPALAMKAAIAEIEDLLTQKAKEDLAEEELLGALNAHIETRLSSAKGADVDAWHKIEQFMALERLRHQVFKRPDVLLWQRGLQTALRETGLVGKSNSLADIVRTVHRDLLAESVDDPKIDQYDAIPKSRGMVAECLLQFQSSHRYGDIDHFVTPDYETSSLWVQLNTGDNQNMAKVVQAAHRFIAQNPPLVPLETKWFGLTYINVVWQDKMVVGMIEAFAGSFLVVFLLMTILFRSLRWGLLSMIPLTVTIAAIYGVIGIVGKDYDMPVAVLSSLTLGLAVDFAIHFLARSRELYRRYGSWQATVPHVFGEPARAITRNIIVIAAGFLPLLLAPLVPYQTVGVFLAAILMVSGIATLLLLPALIRLMEKWLFRQSEKVLAPSCNCSLCLVTSVTAVVLLALNLYSKFGWGTITWISVVTIPALAFACGRLSRRAKCRLLQERAQDAEEMDHESK